MASSARLLSRAHGLLATGITASRTSAVSGVDKCPRPAVSSAKMTSPGPTSRHWPSLVVMAARPESTITHCFRGATCASQSEASSGCSTNAIPLHAKGPDTRRGEHRLQHVSGSPPTRHPQTERLHRPPRKSSGIACIHLRIESSCLTAHFPSAQGMGLRTKSLPILEVDRVVEEWSALGSYGRTTRLSPRPRLSKNHRYTLLP